MTASQENIVWCLDLGNTILKLGRVVNDVLTEVHRWPKSNADACLHWLLTQRADAFAIMSTGFAEEPWINKLAPHAPVWQYDTSKPCPLNIKYETPLSLGQDRLAAAVGAHAIYPETPCLVIDAGTCITYEYLDGEANYLGGNISPGLRMRLKAMHEFTGKLPQVSPVLPEGEIGVSTQTALQNGGLRGAIFELERVILAFRQNNAQGQVVICGGDAGFMLPHLPSGIVHVPDLVLEGLAKLHAYAQ